MNTRPHADGRIVSRILLVESDDDTRGLHGQLLQQIGCEVVEAFDSRDALVKALTYQPALVMTEIHLPFFDGRTPATRFNDANRADSGRHDGKGSRAIRTRTSGGC